MLRWVVLSPTAPLKKMGVFPLSGTRATSTQSCEEEMLMVGRVFDLGQKETNKQTRIIDESA